MGKHSHVAIYKGNEFIIQIQSQELRVEQIKPQAEHEGERMLWCQAKDSSSQCLQCSHWPVYLPNPSKSFLPFPVTHTPYPNHILTTRSAGFLSQSFGSFQNTNVQSCLRSLEGYSNTVPGLGKCFKYFLFLLVSFTSFQVYFSSFAQFSTMKTQVYCNRREGLLTLRTSYGAMLYSLPICSL